MTGKWFLVALVVVMVNLPFVHSSWQERRLDGDGVERVGRVTDLADEGDRRVVSFEVRGETAVEGTVRVDAATYAEAEATREVTVRVLPGSPGVWEVEGEEESRLALVITVVADVALLVLVLLLLRFGSRLRQDMVLVATEDLQRCPPGALIDQVDGLQFVVCGEVETIEDDAVVLDLGDRRVRVVLDGHHNPAGHQQPVRATGVMRS